MASAAPRDRQLFPFKIGEAADLAVLANHEKCLSISVFVHHDDQGVEIGIILLGPGELHSFEKGQLHFVFRQQLRNRFSVRRGSQLAVESRLHLHEC